MKQLKLSFDLAYLPAGRPCFGRAVANTFRWRKLHKGAARSVETHCL